MTAIVIAMLLPHVAGANELGRLFTTPEQREKLEYLRHMEPEPEKPKIEEVLVIEEETGKDEQETGPDIGGLTVKGLVYRENGNSTAWVNDANTFESDFASQYIEIPADEINSDQVLIRIPSTDARVKLKVGQRYLPEDESMQDVVDISGE